jgi:peptidoglycan/LPS O-acetylase OafA/YrhL
MVKSKRVKKIVKSRQKELPVGIHMVSILYYIVSIFLLFVGLLSIVLASSNIEIIVMNMGDFGPLVVILMGTLFMGIGILGAFVGSGLRQRRPWARITAIVLLCITTLMSAYNLYQKGDVETNTIFIIVSIIIGAYLIFSKEVTDIFK